MKRIVLFLTLLVAYGLFLQRGAAPGDLARLDVVGPPAREIENAIAERRFTDALPLALEVGDAHPSSPLIALWLAAIYEGLGRPAEEAAAWERFITSGMEEAEACPGLAEAYARVDEEQGLRAFERCARLDPEDPERRIDLAAAFERMGRPQDALQAYRDAARLDPNHPIAVRGVERLNAKAGDR
jgi:tetratricopeptide (TPR) repeat protein